mgnify:CR=1 FL=1
MANNNGNNGNNGNNNSRNRKGKRDLKKRSISSSSVLVQLYNNRKVVTKVDNMLDEGQTYDYIIEFCKDNGIEISKSSLTNYKQKREESIRTGTPLIQLLDRRTKDNVTYITDRGVDMLKRGNTNNNGDSNSSPTENLNRVENVYNDLEFLDEVIRKGMKGLKAFDVVDTPLAMKAIELRAKITNNQLSGLSIAGLREIKLRQQARESALMEVIMKYVPQDKHDDLFEDMDAAEKAFYENLDLTEEDRRATKAFKDANIDL